MDLILICSAIIGGYPVLLVLAVWILIRGTWLFFIGLTDKPAYYDLFPSKPSNWNPKRWPALVARGYRAVKTELLVHPADRPQHHFSSKRDQQSP